MRVLSGDQKWLKGLSTKKAKSKPSYAASVSNDSKGKYVVCKGDQFMDGMCCIPRAISSEEDGHCKGELDMPELPQARTPCKRVLVRSEV